MKESAHSIALSYARAAPQRLSRPAPSETWHPHGQKPEMPQPAPSDAFITFSCPEQEQSVFPASVSAMLNRICRTSIPGRNFLLRARPLMLPPVPRQAELWGAPGLRTKASAPRPEAFHPLNPAQNTRAALPHNTKTETEHDKFPVSGPNQL